MKKSFSFILAICMCLSLLFTLASCEDHEHEFESKWSKDSDYHWHACINSNCEVTEDKEEHDFEVEYDENGAPYNKCSVCEKQNTNVNTAPAHNHIFADEFSSSENFHWKECITAGCIETIEKNEHQYANPEVEYAASSITMIYVCEVCNYRRIETKTVDTQLDNATHWNEMFENFELTNFSMYVYINGVDDEDTRHCMVDSDTVYYCIPDGRTFYSQKNPDGTYNTYVKDWENNKYELSDDHTETAFVAGAREPVIRVSFADNFDKFTYDEETASYKCSEAIEAEFTNFSGTEWQKMYCYNSVIKVNDGKILYIECDYNFDLDGVGKSSFIYYNIGITDFSVPPQVVEEARR